MIRYRKEGLDDEQIFSLGQRSPSAKYNGKAIEYNGRVYETLGSFNQNFSAYLFHFIKMGQSISFNAELCVQIVKLARYVSSISDLSFKGCLSRASSSVRRNVSI